VAIVYDIKLDGLGALGRLSSTTAKVPAELGMFGDEYRAKHGLAWERMKYANLNTGSVSFRGETMWASTPDQYTRKEDGVTVPPWGGVPRIRAGFKEVARGIVFASDISTRKTTSRPTGKSVFGRQSRVSGAVSGRRRPSGQRVEASSTMMVDTARMRSSFLTPRFEANGFRLVFEIPSGEDSYARVQNALRRFAFFTTNDGESLRDRIRDLFSRGTS